MKKILQLIVGYPTGFEKEGNRQWYYTLALIMNCMLIWWLKPELGVLFTVCAVIHFAMTVIYGLNDLVDFSANKRCLMYSILYFVIHLILFIVCMIFSWQWALITSAVVVVACLIAPDDMGYNIFMRAPKGYDLDCGNNNVAGILLCHTVWIVIFAIITLLLPISIWIRIAIIVACMILHPFIDILEGECVDVVEIAYDAFYNIVDNFKNKKKSMADEQNHKTKA